MPIARRLPVLAACVLLLPGTLRPQAPAAPTKPEATPTPAASPILGSWLTSIRRPDGSAADIYEIFSGKEDWRSVAVFRDNHGKVSTLAVWGTFKLTPAGSGTYRLVTATDDYSPRHRCVVNGACEPLTSLSGVDATIVFPDPDHLGSPGEQVIAVRLRQLPIEAETPVPHVQMVTANGEIVNAPTPLGLDDPRFEHPRKTACDDLQQQRICNLNDGTMYTGKDGCKHCSK